MLTRGASLLGVLFMAMLLVAVACAKAEPAPTPAPAPSPTVAPAPRPPAAPAPVPTTAPAPTPTRAPAPAAQPTVGPLAGAKAPGLIPREETVNVKYGGTLRGFVPSDIPNLDLFVQQSTPNMTIANGFYNKLLEWDPRDFETILPELAESWKVSPDGKVYTFTLRKDVKWHDGVPFTAADVAATYDRWRLLWQKFARGARYGGFLDPLVDSWRVVDAYTFEVTLKQPSSGFIPIVTSAHSLVFPKHKIEKVDAARFEPLFTTDSPPVGTGPFKYGKYTPLISMTWTKNKEYWKKDFSGKPLPYLDGVDLTVLADDTIRFAAFRTNRVDMWPTTPNLSPSQARELERTLGNKIQIVQFARNVLDYVGFNFQHPLTKERDFRWAVGLIIDTTEWKERAYEGLLLDSVILDPRLYSDLAIPRDEVRKNLLYKQPKDEAHAEARRLLAKLGITPQTPVEMKVYGQQFGSYPAEAEVLAKQLAPFGLKVRVEVLPQAVGSPRFTAGEFEFQPSATTQVVKDPLTLYQQLFQPVPPHAWVTPDGKVAPAQIKINSLIDKAIRALDPKEKKEAIQEIQRVLITEDFPRFTTGWTDGIITKYNYVKGRFFAGGLQEGLTNERVWLDK